MAKVVMIRTCLVVLLLCCCTSGFSQQTVPPLERKVTVNFENTLVKEALFLLEQQAQFSFAYKTGIIDEQQVLNRSYLDKTIREIINDLFQGKIHPVAKGNYILLKQVPPLTSHEVVLEGYIMDATTQQKIPYATIYETQTLASAISDEYGHYLLKFKLEDQVELNVKKANYQDTAFVFAKGTTPVLTVFLQAIDRQDEVVMPPLTIDSLSNSERIAALKWLKLSDERKATIENFGTLMKQTMQFSVLPTIGTNGRLSSAASTKVSFNLLGGIVGEVKGFELAGLFNIDVDTVQYGQIAGLFNVVGGPQTGAQIAGLFNQNLSGFKGSQIGGISNVVLKDVRGVQIGGITNIVKEQLTGVQIGGISNLVVQKAKGIQIAGISNFSFDSSSVIQIAGIYNHLGQHSKGIQLAGCVNVAEDDFTGIQVSGLVNKAQNMKGLQIGLVNYSNSIKGIPVGLFSYSKKGLHQLEIATTEFLPFQLGYKSGVNHFYNSFFVASRITPDFTLIGIGYGLGSSIRLGERHRLFFDLQNQQLFNRMKLDNNYLHRFTISYQYQWKKKLAIAVGPTFNFLNVKNNSTEANAILNLAPYHIYQNTTSNGYQEKMWIGGFIALRLF